LVLPRDVVHAFIRHQLTRDSDAYHTLKTRHFLVDADSTVPIELLAAKYRTKLDFLRQFTSLFMFVTTLRCDHTCLYCHASSRPMDAPDCDMQPAVADRAIDFMFRGPSPSIKVEFQGGESLLNFDIVRHIVEATQERSQTAHKHVEFVITSNLSALTDPILDFCQIQDVYFSTSLDGPRTLHNAQRPRRGNDSYDDVTRGIRRIQEALGPNRISALMTTTRASLGHAREIVDEYVSQGLTSIFLRPLNPYGRAAASGAAAECNSEQWLDFYRQSLDYILELCRGGVALREEYTSCILRKILTPYPTGFVDLQSPAGIGIGGIVFHFNGDVYCSDEARMLAEMGDQTFRMGNLFENAYDEIMLFGPFLDVLSGSIADCVPQCADCGILPYCGSDPVRHYRTQGDVIGFKPTSEMCLKQLGVVRHIVRLLEDDADAASILRTWA
jgi:uncharacterized protein